MLFEPPTLIAVIAGPGDDGVMAFTDFGIETLTGLIEIYNADPDLLKRWPPTLSDLAAAYACCHLFWQNNFRSTRAGSGSHSATAYR